MESLGILFKMWEIPAVRCGEAGWTITNTSTNTNKVQVQIQIQIQIPAARSEEDGGTDQRPSWLQEQNSQRQVGQADVGHLSVLFQSKILVLTEKYAVMRCPGSRSTSH